MPPIKGFRYRRIVCPDPVDGRTFRAMNQLSGEIIECADLVGIFRHVATASWPASVWTIECRAVAE